jgi:hypothetical protein
MCWKIIISKGGDMKKNQWVAVIMVASIPSLALAGMGPAPVPQPASMLFFGAGHIGLPIMGKKNRAKRV